MHYVEWGPPGAPPVVCAHGLTRNGRDFDALADGLIGPDRRVVCPDIAGRGRSDWLADPALYSLPKYCSDMAALIARLDAGSVDWIGTSMGGLIGLILAAQPNTPIRRLVLNDIAPVVPQAALRELGTYVGLDPSFPDMPALEAAMRTTYAGFGPLTDAQWRHLAEHSVREKSDGTLGFAYDPAIGQPFLTAAEGVDLWPFWDRIECPVLVLRGADSQFLTADLAQEMAARGPKARVIEIAGCGHAPSLMAYDQIALVRDFLDE